MCTSAYTPASCVGDMTMMHVGHIGPEDPGCLCEVPECLLIQERPWNPEVPARVLGDGNHDTVSWSSSLQNDFHFVKI